MRLSGTVYCNKLLVQRGAGLPVLGRGVEGRLPLFPGLVSLGMPNKHNDARRHHIPKMKFQVTNWAAYEAGLRRRGSLTLWVSDAAIAAWRAAPRRTPGGQAERVNDYGLLASFGESVASRNRRLRRSKLARPNI